MLDKNFLNKVAPLYSADLGTEHAAGLLYSMVRMLRPKSVLEIGLGYTTPFLLQALHDNKQEFAADREILKNKDDALRLDVLRAEAYEEEYDPVLLAIDDYSDEESTAHKVSEVIDDLDLAPFLKLYQRSFSGLSTEIEDRFKPIDLIWFDCGGPQEYVDFINEYWPLINPDGGVLLMHYSYWHMPTIDRRRYGTPVSPARLEPCAVLREIKRQHAKLGLDAHFEVSTIVEPHKARQGSISLIRKVSDAPINAEEDMSQELADQDFKADYKPFSM